MAHLRFRFAVESQLDIIAEELGIDPIEIRLKNARQKGDILPNGDTIKNAGLIECIEEIEKKTDFRKKYSKNLKEVKQYKNNTRFRRGIGIGVSSYFTGTLIYPHNSAAIIKFNDDGTVQCYTGALDIAKVQKPFSPKLLQKNYPLI